ncbi:MAG: homogentisate 1,2-dioxygenase [Vicinamibacteria bacterium]
MHRYHRLGLLPAKRHIALRRADGGLYYEELIGNRGFTGPSSLVYHLYLPTTVKASEMVRETKIEAEPTRDVRNRHFDSAKVASGPSLTLDRTPVLFNSDVIMSIACPTLTDTAFARNGQFDELVYIAQGQGKLESAFGDVAYRQGDYVVVPRGIVHRFVLGDGPHRYVIFESAGYVRAPHRYRGEHGQLVEGAPYSERDFRVPENLNPRDEKGDFDILVKAHDVLTRVVLDHHPFDVVGWDGHYYPFAFSIHDFEPKVGRVHLPPPVHQTFEAEGFVICSFCPRPYDFDKDAIPAPYSHTNAMSDEMIFYASAEFMSRKGVGFGSITLHPDGLPHGPQPGRTEASMGATWADELAVMLDTFKPLHVAKGVLSAEDPTYWRSWV